MKEVDFKLRPAGSPSLPEEIRSVSSGQIVSDSNYLYLMMDGQVLSSPNNETAYSFLSLLSECFKHKSGFCGYDNQWIKLLCGNFDLSELNDIKRKYSFKSGKFRVFVFRVISDNSKDSSPSLFFNLLPLEETDVFLPFDQNTFVIVKDEKETDEDDNLDFAAAVIDTINTETGIILKAGIGRYVSNLSDLSASYDEAVSALNTGERFRLSDSVFSFNRLKVERIVEMIPPEKVNILKSEYLPSGLKKALNDEMLNTVRTFFKNDLNISTTSRELYIHRNTLIYRLDKIKKEIGLDVRKFQDALVFKILVDILRKESIS